MYKTTESSVLDEVAEFPGGDNIRQFHPPSHREEKEADLDRKDMDTRSQRLMERKNSLMLYLTEIGKVKLLTASEEVELANRIRSGDEKARELMIKGNLRLVVKIARDYEDMGLPLLDLISEGNIGLMKAVERYDPTRGARLSTYASWWIKQAIKRALSTQVKTIRLPTHILDKLSKMRKAEKALYEVFGREPTDHELAEELGTSSSNVSEMRLASIRPTSLDAPIGPDQDSNSYSEIVADENAEVASDSIDDKTQLRMLKEMVESLPPRDAYILRARFGLEDGSPQTLDEVAVTVRITRERVRQLHDRAIGKLRKKFKKLESSQGRGAIGNCLFR